MRMCLHMSKRRRRRAEQVRPRPRHCALLWFVTSTKLQIRKRLFTCRWVPTTWRERGECESKTHACAESGWGHAYVRKLYQSPQGSEASTAPITFHPTGEVRVVVRGDDVVFGWLEVCAVPSNTKTLNNLRHGAERSQVCEFRFGIRDRREASTWSAARFEIERRSESSAQPSSQNNWDRSQLQLELQQSSHGQPFRTKHGVRRL